MLLGDPRQADQRTQSFNFSMVIHQSLDPAAQGPSSLSLHACVNQSSTVCFLAPTSALEHLTTCRSTGQTQIQNATRRRTVEAIKMHDHDFKVISMTSQASLSLSPLLTKVTHAQYTRCVSAWYKAAGSYCCACIAFSLLSAFSLAIQYGCWDCLFLLLATGTTYKSATYCSLWSHSHLIPSIFTRGPLVRSLVSVHLTP